MNQSIYHFSPLSVRSACPDTQTAHAGGSSFKPLAASDVSTFLSFDLDISNDKLYLGQYYKLTFNLTNTSSNVLSSLEVNCKLQKEWRLIDTEPIALPAYITVLTPGETFSFTLSMQLISLPSEDPFYIKSFVSYHVNYEAMTYIKNCNPLSFSIAPDQASVILSSHEEDESATCYELIVHNIGTNVLTKPVLYIYMPTSIHLIPESFAINGDIQPYMRLSHGIRLSSMPPKTLYKFTFSTSFSSGHPSKELPIIQFVTNNIMFCPLLHI